MNDVKKCVHCSIELSNNRMQHPRAKFCSKPCQQDYYRAEWQKRNKVSGLKAGTVGAMLELLVCVDLMQRGKHVFRAVSPNCPFDLAYFEKGILRGVEVRTGYMTNNDEVRWTDNRGGSDIWAIGVGERIFYFDKERQLLKGEW